MVVQNISVGSCTTQTITIGRRNTYDTQQIVFDLSYLIENYGSGTAVLMVKGAQNETAYPAITVQEYMTLIWNVSATDTSYPGNGECELFWYVEDGLAKSAIYPLVILKDIGETIEEPPDAYQNWVDHLTELGAETLQNAQAAEQSAENAAQSETNAKASEESAAESEANADNDALKSEGFAIGEQNGVIVVPGSPYYQNNAKYYADVAQQGAEETGYVWFDVNDQDGEMYVTITPNLEEDVSFLVNEAVGILEVTYA